MAPAHRCSYCHGLGILRDSGNIRCPRCRGEGYESCRATIRHGYCADAATAHKPEVLPPDWRSR